MSMENASTERLEYEYVYHWERIVGIIALVGAIAGGSVWALNKRSAPASEATASVASTTATTAVVNETPPPAAPATTTQGTVAAKADTGVAPAIASHDAPVAKPVAASAPASGLGSVAVHDKRLSDVTLKQVIDEEQIPLDNGTIHVGTTKAVRVVFAATHPHAGDYVQFNWLREGKFSSVMKTRVSPQSQAIGNKYFSADLLGNWKVQMLDGNGKVLAEGSFRAEPMK